MAELIAFVSERGEPKVDTVTWGNGREAPASKRDANWDDPGSAVNPIRVMAAYGPNAHSLASDNRGE